MRSGRGNGVNLLNLTLGYDASKLHFGSVSTAESGANVATVGSATVTGSSGSVGLHWTDTTPTGYDGMDLTAHSTHAWFATT